MTKNVSSSIIDNHYCFPIAYVQIPVYSYIGIQLHTLCSNLLSIHLKVAKKIYSNSEVA